MEEIKDGEKKENNIGIKAPEPVKNADSVKIKKIHLIIGVMVLIVIVGVVMAFALKSNNITGSAVSDTDLAAEVNGEKISMAFLNTEYERIPTEQRSLIRRMDVLNQTIINIILLQQAKKEDITVTDQEVEDILNEVPLPAAQTLEAIAQVQGFTLDEFKSRIKEQIVIQRLLNQSLVVDVSNQEIEDYFNKNKDLFKQKLSVNASHILVNNSKDANVVLKELKKGRSFEEVAKELSIDPGTKDNGGNLGVFPKGVMIKEFEDAAFDLKVGEVSIPIKSPFGVHIIKVYDRIEEKDADLEESKDKIEELVRREKLNQAVGDYINNIYNGAKVKIYLKEE